MGWHELEAIGAVLRGHFLLTSGKHSDLYFEKFRLLERPDILARAVSAMLAQLRMVTVQAVVGPTLGGVLVAYETARQLGVPALYSEREGAERAFRRGYFLKEGAPVLVVDDVLTTGTSIREVLTLLQEVGATPVAVGVLIDRSEKLPEFGVPLVSAMRLPAKTYDPPECPLCQQGIPIQKRGSRS